ncbi:hypothetical protein ABW11_14885 [Pluralibacter gergoviae]|nr:hypothetical protein ABW08_15150 [Pluralibacter gergoviae]KMK26395.1 hypothetical protein ABW11_14885 [Pluralibacter gergoviae]
MTVAILLVGMTGRCLHYDDLWHFVSVLSARLNFISTKTMVSALLTFRLVESNAYVNFYRAGDRVLEDGLRISDLELRLSKENGRTPLLLSFSLQGSCITLDAVKAHYPHLTLTDYPRAGSQNEVASYTASAGASGLAVTFSFAVKQPDCLSQVVISDKQ